MTNSAGFRLARLGIERLAPGYALPRHQHGEAYATVLLRGAFEQASYAGRMRVEAGQVLIQPTLDAHADRMLSAAVPRGLLASLALEHATMPPVLAAC